MEHHFDTDDAEKLGVEAAIILYNIRFWVKKNKANNKHQYDGKTWTYNSLEAWTELFPYIKPRTIRTTLEKLVESGVLLKGNFNENKWDRTTWYALKNEEDEVKKVSKKRQMHLSETSNAFVNPDKSSIKKHIKNTDRKRPTLFSAPFLSSASGKYRDELWAWNGEIDNIISKQAKQSDRDSLKAAIAMFLTRQSDEGKLIGRDRADLTEHFFSWAKTQRQILSEQANIDRWRQEYEETLNWYKRDNHIQ